MNGEDYLRTQLIAALKKTGFAQPEEIFVNLERPKIAGHGDLATNIAMLLAPKIKRNPREIAAELLAALQLDRTLIASAEIAGAGFINFRFANQYYHAVVKDILKQKAAYGRSTWGDNQRVQIEFISANPTGPLNIVSARAAAVGDVLANLFNAVGYAVEREYYVNDAGRQVRLLGQSVSSRYMELLGKEEPFPEDGYHGDYIREVAREILRQHGEVFVEKSPGQRQLELSEIALESLLSTHKSVLKQYRLQFDNWFRERTLRESNAHLDILATLTEKGFVYDLENAKWFKSTQFGDEKDRVLVTSEGEPTYFLVDIAYHADKFERDFVQLYDLWGPDHHGYIPRMKAALLALGYPAKSFEVNIIQQVNLIEDGAVVKMSKRAGKIILMQELLDEVGVDVARFFFTARRSQSPLDFDMDLAKNTSDENPVYYVQYAHARICNVIGHAAAQGVQFDPEADLDALAQEQEITLIKKLAEFPQTISKAAKLLEQHRIPTYLQDLAGLFHRFYHHCRVVTDDKQLTLARLSLVKATQIVVANALALLGVSAPEQM